MSLTRTATFLSAAALGLAATLAAPAPTRADDSIRTYSKKGNFADVKTDLTETIVNRGLKIDYNGNIGAMLERTGADVGSTKPVYKGAEFFTFCSAKLSRTMMEADPMNLGSCPYVMFIYESAAKPGEVTVGYRLPGARGDDASKKSLAEVEALLDGIAKETVK